MQGEKFTTYPLSIPNDIFKMDFESYSRFLQERRTLMVQKIKDYYYSL